MANASGMSVDLLHQPVAPTLLRFSFPFMLSTLLQTLYSTTDMVVIGQFLGGAGLAAVSNGSQLMQLLYMVCIGFSTAGQILIAQAVGAKNYEKTQKVVGTLFALEIALSLLISAVCLIFSRQMLSALMTPAEAVVQARYYTLICGAGMIFTGLYNMFSAVLRGMGDSRHPLLFVFIASVLNIILDVLFIAVFHWNVAGTAAATVIGQAVSVLFSIWFLRRHSEELHFHLELKDLLPDKPTAGQLVKIGTPLAIQSAAIQLSFLFVSRMVNSLDILALSSAFGVTQKIRSIPTILTQALNLGASSMIGQNLGARQLDRVKSTVNWGLLFATVINAVFALLFFLFPVLCFRLFTADQDVLAYAVMCMFTLLLELPGRCLMPSCNALVSAQGFVQFSFAVAFLDAFVGRILFCWLLGIVFNLGALGFFLGYSAGTYLTAIPVFIYYISGLWKKRAALV